MIAIGKFKLFFGMEYSITFFVINVKFTGKNVMLIAKSPKLVVAFTFKWPFQGRHNSFYYN